MAAPSKKVFELFVSKVPWTVATKEIKEYFGQFGQVKKCLLVFDKDTGFHRGFCWVSYSSEEGLQNALQKEPHVMEGSRLLVQKNRRPFIGKKANKEADES
ncbi:SRA stem-loop-interacting RNA-binding protein, mitochondrial [Neoarius graeffei]|uniref:SRA stem-loop-interacting RNA-binding protein, mitochondrial n=1 Tax=Neoarius graeffei TaxID=443677 RepID=UPI00298D4D1E|nr:SRA stem-loop-interacting RNA-binding protein, mitochondrial [Neoarius graeffei]